MMKKIISLLSAVAMLSASFVAFAAVGEIPAQDGSVTVITSTPVAIDNTTYEDNTGESVGEGYTAYQIGVSLSGTNGLDRTNRLQETGRLLSQLNYEITFADLTNVQQTGALSLADGQLVNAGDFATNTWNDKTYVVTYTGKFPGKEVAEYTDEDLTDMAVLYFVIKDGTSVTATVTNAAVVIGDYAKGVTTNATDYKIPAGTLTVSPATITFGSAPADPTPVAPIWSSAPEAPESEQGFVWADYTATNIDTDLNDYFAEFSTATETKQLAIDLGNITGGGSITFDVVLKTTKAVTGFIIKALEKAAN